MWVARRPIQPGGDGPVAGGSRNDHGVRPFGGFRQDRTTPGAHARVPCTTDRRKGGQGRVDDASEREFAEYFRARRDAVRRTAFLLCGDWHRADDHAQAAFVALHRHWRRIRDRDALDAWVRRTLVRAVVDESRRPWRRERATAEPPPETVGVPSASEAVTTRH